MILFTILMIIIVLLTALVVAVVSTVGAAGIVVFGDVIVCIFLLGLLIKILFFRKSKN